MIKYPLFFTASSSVSPGIQTPWSSSASHLAQIPCSIPTSFGGPGLGYSPEDLLAMAVMNCFAATFKVFAEKSHFTFSRLQLEVGLEINRSNNQQVGIVHIQLKIALESTEDPSKGHLLLEETQKNCMVASALKIPVTFTISLI